MRTIVWFRGDLRTLDNPALTHATHHSDDGVIAVFTVCPGQWLDEHDWSDAKVDFILRTLQELQPALGTLKIPLKVIECDTFAGVPDALLEFAKRHDADALCFNEEYEVNERCRDERVRSRFEDAGLKVRSFMDQAIIEPTSIRTGDDGYYSVYSPFKRKFYAMHDEGAARGIADEPKRQQAMPCDHDGIPESVRGFERTPGIAQHWPAGEEHARQRLGKFCSERIKAYKDERDTPAIDATSALSPYLTIGAISTQQCLEAALDANQRRLQKGSRGADHWISEIVWREFYRHIVVGYPRVCRHQPFRLDTRAIEWAENDEHFEAWKQGRTGVPIVDAGMRQLAETGWMHNRLRMIVAMYLTKDLFLDWRLGERHFMRSLIDGDLASNNGGWQWSASTGVDAAPYFRIFNPYSQSAKCDPDGAFIRRYVPELADIDGDEIHDPNDIPGLLRSQLDYPEPIVDHKKARERAIEAFKALKG